MPGRAFGRRPPIQIEIPERAAVVVVGRTLTDCGRLVGLLRPLAEAKGASLKSFSQVHQIEELARERVDVLVLDSSLGPTARDTVVWTVQRSNRTVAVHTPSL